MGFHRPAELTPGGPARGVRLLALGHAAPPRIAAERGRGGRWRARYGLR
ncbi:hypothetical protein FHS38_006075 [Streptomyces netropsis]|uniref:Uncharacterized protein n=1 Tax=Streptomyces netropsis TaxID=55404 RepID=A0A7W7PHI4_STRNE|nr:hypothetical protein [Streptomyces netropsis]